MITLNHATFQNLMYDLADNLLHTAKPVDSLTWQSQSTSGRAGMNRTWELEDVMVTMAVPPTPDQMATLVEPNVTWANAHFLERVSGQPLNPPPSHEIWPHRQRDNEEHLDPTHKFSHTYPERFWPIHAGHTPMMCGVGSQDDTSLCDFGPTMGIRYQYGDLLDVVSLMQRDPTTRQAYLPVWFPEDTGSIHGQRVPCTLGYHFRYRQGQLNCTYYLRSCDYVRHLRDDIYLAMRLQHWVGERLIVDDMPTPPGTLTLAIGSLHIFDGDIPWMRHWVRELRGRASQAMMEAMG